MVDICNHVATAIHFPDELTFCSSEFKCADGGCNEPYLWICLFKECLHIGCSVQENGSSILHNCKKPNHFVCMNLSTKSLWCHQCSKEVFFGLPPYIVMDPESEIDSGNQNIDVAIIPLETFTSITCFSCKGYLSIPPIISTNSEGTEHKCGRCEHVQMNYSTRNVPFENMAKYVRFPCIYTNCEEKIFWGESMKDHEMVCPMKTIICPHLDCTETVKLNLFALHFLAQHSDSLSEDQFLLGRDLSNICYVRCVMKNDIPFVIYLRWNWSQNQNIRSGYRQQIIESDVYISVFSILPTDMEYDVMVSSPDMSSGQINIKSQKIQTYVERIHCSKCFLENGSCAVTYHNKNSVTMQTCINNNILVNYWVESSKPVLVSVTIIKPYVKLKQTATNLFSQLKCSVCFLYFNIPIYICKTGHSICNECNQKIEKCPLCASDFQGSRNFNLERIAACVEIQCSNAVNGCEFIGNSIKLREHEKRCSFI